MSSIRQVIAGLTRLTPDEIAARDAAVRDGRCSEWLWPFWPIADQDRELWQLLADDRQIVGFSVYGLFPESYDLVYGVNGDGASIRYDGRTRGRVAMIRGNRRGDRVDLVIKPCQSPREAEIALVAGELGLGPRQFASIDGFLTEEFVDGPFLTELDDSDVSPARMHAIGQQLGTALARLHRAGVCYNDALVADPEGRSHTILQTDGSIRIIDFGVALLLRDHPANLTFHDAYNAARTDPMYRLFRQMTSGADDEALGRFVADYGRQLAGQTVRQIQSRDWRIAGEGIPVIAGMYGPEAAEALRAGISVGRASVEPDLPGF